MTERTSILRRSGLVLFGALAMALVACNGDGGGGGGGGGGGIRPDGGVVPDGGGQPPPTGQARLRVVNAASGAPDLDVYVVGSDAPILENLAYREVSPYVELEPGNVQLALRPAGSPASSEPLLVTEPIELVKDERVTAVAGVSIDADGQQVFQIVAATESFADPGVGRAMIRVIHASPDLNNIAVDVAPGDGKEVAKLGRFGVTAAAGIPVPADENLRIEVSALEQWTWRAGIFTLPPLAEGEGVFVIALGVQTDNPRNPDSFSLLVVGADGESELIRHDPVFYVIHGIPDAPNLNVDISGQQYPIWNLAYAALSGGQAVMPGAHDLTFRTTEGGEILGTATTPKLERARRYLVVAAGYATPEQDQPGLQIATAVDDFALELPEETAQAEVIHAVADAPALDVSTLKDGRLTAPLLVTDLAFADASDPFALPIGLVELGAAETGAVWPLFRFSLPTGDAPKVFAVPVGTLDPSWDEKYLKTVKVNASGKTWRQIADDAAR